MRTRALTIILLGLVAAFVSPFSSAEALELDWSGQFWAEFTIVNDYAMDRSAQGTTVDSKRSGADGYYVPGGGDDNATFQNLFLRLRPKLIVNDNIYIKSEWWVGNPIFGVFGGAVPYSTDQRQYYSTQSRGSVITAQRVWGEFISDIGTFQVGRVPLQWGLGAVWDAGEPLWSRYMSTGDAVRWIAKFGAFSFVPSFILPSAGNTIGGSCIVDSSGVCVPGVGIGGVTDYSIILKYENSEDELEGGLNFIKRLAGANQDPNSGLLTPQGGAGGMNYLTYDIYAKKKFSNFTLGAEIPVVNGSIAGANYSSFAFVLEADWKASDVWDFQFKAGHVSGQTNLDSQSIDTYRAFYLNPNYHIGMIMFNYQLANFAGPQTNNDPGLSPTQMASPYNNPIVDAQYISIAPQIKPWEKWTFRPGVTYARAPRTAIAGQYFFNNWTHSVSDAPAVKDQGSSLGWEIDLGITFQWDEYFQFTLDEGVFFPGSFYAFSNTAQDNRLSPVFATALRVGVNF